MKLSVETDDTTKMKTLVVLADIVLRNELSNLYLFEAVNEIGFFADMFRMFLGRNDEASYDSESLIAMSRSLEGVVSKMRVMAQEIEMEVTRNADQ